jgi:hypothetical protein
MTLLLHSRKFWLAVFGVAQAVVLYYVHVPDVVWQAIAGLVAVLIAGIAVEDAGTNAGVSLAAMQPPPAPQSININTSPSPTPAPVVPANYNVTYAAPPANWKPNTIAYPVGKGATATMPLPPSYDPRNSLDYPIPPAPPLTISNPHDVIATNNPALWIYPPAPVTDNPVSPADQAPTKPA